MQTIPKTIGSQHVIRQGILGAPISSGYSGGTMLPVYPKGIMPQTLSVRQQLSAWKGWKYVAGHRIATCCGSIEPELGRIVPMKSGEYQKIDGKMRQHLIQYGVSVKPHEDWQVVDRHPVLDLLAFPKRSLRPCRGTHSAIFAKPGSLS